MLRTTPSIKRRLAAVIGGAVITVAASTGSALAQYTPAPAPVPGSAVPQAAPASAPQVAGVQITATTVAPVAAPAVAAAAPSSVAQAPASVLGVQEEAGEVALTGSNSGTFTAAGIALTAAGALLIGATRRRRSAQN
jgi:hypothetical protein